MISPNMMHRHPLVIENYNDALWTLVFEENDDLSEKPDIVVKFGYIIHDTHQIAHRPFSIPQRFFVIPPSFQCRKHPEFLASRMR